MQSSHIRVGYVSFLLVFGLLAGCGGGGADTVSNPTLEDTVSNQNLEDTAENPNPTSDNNQNYNGPPPATTEVFAFQTNVWTNLKGQNRCGQCHGQDQAPMFVDPDDINVAYAHAVSLVSLTDPASSLLVTKVGGGHNCWLTSTVACADSVEQMINNWVGSSESASTRGIVLAAPVIKVPGDSKSFPDSSVDNAPNSFANTIHPLLTKYCQSCHDDSTALPIAPFFANADPVTAYESAKSKLDIDIPANSRFVVRLREEFHNCWSDDCANDAAALQTAIESFANAITPTAINTDLITSKALRLTDGVIASGGNRHESNLIAIWEFKARSGNTAFDTSGIEPAINLTLSGSYNWLDEFGINLKGGKAQGDTSKSQKLNDFIRSSGEYSIEAWVIPANVTQEDANIVSYSAGAASRNVTLGQALYNYDFYNRSSESDANGVEFLSTNAAGEILQPNLQHVVATYHPIDGRRIFVNGSLVEVNDPVTVSTSIADWDDSYAVVFGNEISNDRPWSGKLRMVAIHNRVLTPAQVVQNYDIGVGEKFFLLFSVAERIGIPDSYVLFEVSLFDSYGYLFNKPKFINLDPNWVPVSVDLEGLRIGINGKQAVSGQAFASLKTSIDSGTYTAQDGQLLSSLGAIIALEKGSDNDEFFLTFENLNGKSHPFDDPAGIPTTPGPDAAAVSDIGIRTFDEINASIAAITGVSITNTAIDGLFQQYRQQLPTVESIESFLPSHQMAIAQLALASCSELVDNNPGFFSGFNFAASASTAFDNASKRDQVMTPLLAAAANVYPSNSANNLTSQPDEAELKDVLGSTSTLDLDTDLVGDSYLSLMSQMQACLPGCDTTNRTVEIVKATCAAVVGGAVMLVQ